jgi:hypothetical protein
LDVICDPDALVSYEEKYDGHNASSREELDHMVATGIVVDRMEELHQKLCTSLRVAVKISFSENGDVLDAGSAVQVRPLACSNCRFVFMIV